MPDVPAIRITAVDQASAVIANVQRSFSGLTAQLVSVAAVVETMRRSLNLGDDLKRMADTTGLAIDKLDKLSIIASQNETSLEGMAKAFKFLTSSMIEAQSATSQSGKLFAALGVSIKDAQGNMRSVDDVMADVSDSLNTVGNETVRMAAGTAIFGKSYLEVAAALRNYRESQDVANQVLERYGTVSQTAANLSDQLKDKFDVMAQGSKRALLNGMVPGIAAVIEGLDRLTSSGGMFTQSFGKVVSDAVVWVTQSFISLQGAIQVVGVSIGAVAAVIATRSLEPLRAARDDIQKIFSDIAAAQAAVGTAAAFPGLDNSDQVSRAAGAQERMNRTQADSKAIADALAPAQAKVKDVWEDMVRALDLAAAKQANLGELGKVDVELSQKQFQGTTMRDAAMRLYVRAMAAAVDEAKALEETGKANADAFLKESEAMDALAKKYQETQKSVEDYVANLEFEVKAMQMSDQERTIAIGLRELERKGIGLTAEALDEYRARLIAATEYKEALQGQIDLWKGIEGAAHDAFMHIFESGKSVFERLTDALKNTLLELLYQMTVKKWIVDISTEVSGNAGMLGGATGGAGSLGNLAGGIGSLFSGSGLGLGSALSSAGSLASIGGGFMGLGGAGAGLVTGEAVSGAAAGAGLMTTLGPLMAAVPYVGIAIAAAMIIKSVLDSKKGGPKVGGNAGYATYFPGEGTAAGNQGMQALLASTTSSYKAIVAAFGGKGSAQFAFGFDTDPQGKAPNRVNAGAMVGGQQVYRADLPNLGRDDAVLKAALETESKRALLAALQASSFPDDIAHIFNAVQAASASSADIDKILAIAEAFGNIGEMLSSLDDVGATLDKISNRTALDAFHAQGDALDELVANFDGSVDATKALSDASAGYYQSLVALVGQLRSVQKSINQMFGGSRESVFLTGRSSEFQYQYLQDKANKDFGTLGTLTDPGQIQALANTINDEITRAFGLLSPEQQVAMRDQFIAQIDKVNSAFDARLGELTRNVTENGKTELQQIKDAMSAAADDMSTAAGHLSDSAGDISAASRDLGSTPIHVIVDGSAVGGGSGGN